MGSENEQKAYRPYPIERRNVTTCLQDYVRGARRAAARSARQAAGGGCEIHLGALKAEEFRVIVMGIWTLAINRRV